QETTKPIRNALVNEYLPGSSYRATVLSMGGCFGSALAALSMITFSILSTQATPEIYLYQRNLTLLGAVATITISLSLPMYLALREGSATTAERETRLRSDPAAEAPATRPQPSAGSR